ncbi:hypothetical protein JR316_0003863 [Psilocybe cubensis]|uniref:Transmembrane protein n=2 Tax=Psilocybe cubensis TaxID=181762 RepID=A0A8H8CNG5_PSICU|nr:hypothetical protein JR316_0003863 [Psilocybe cubensis]KAH9484382.1 hypothetical protein JR316_0003863 [Psilocybe cubensis]
MLGHIAEKIQSTSPRVLSSWRRSSRSAAPVQSRPLAVHGKRRPFSLEAIKAIFVVASRSIRRYCIPRNDVIQFTLNWTMLVGTCLTGFVFFALHMTVKPTQFVAPMDMDPSLFQPDVNLTAEVVSVDPVSRTIIMNWYPELVDQSCNISDPIIVDIFIPKVLLDATSPSFSTDTDDNAVIRMNNTALCFALDQNYISFRTVTKLVASKEFLVAESIGTQRTFQSYPFDVYVAPFTFYSENLATPGVTKPLRVSQSFGIAVNFEISLIRYFVAMPYIHTEQNLQFYLKIERSTATKAFVVIVAITNWITAVTFLTILASTLVYHPHEIYSELFVVPVGAVFAFSSVRSNLPGAPAGFGATIDLYTILPVLVIMSFCSVALLLTVLYRRIKEEKAKHIKITGDDASSQP